MEKVNKKKEKKIIDKITFKNINKGQDIYFKNELHYIVYEFDENIIISKNIDLSKAYCVKKRKVSIKPTK